MAEASLNKQCLKEIRELKKELDFIKNYLIDHDITLDESDKKAIQDYKKEKENNELISHEELKKELP